MRSLWHYVDKFGHAARYLNWTQWLYLGTDLSDLTVPTSFEVPDELGIDGQPAGVELETKLPLLDRDAARLALTSIGLREEPEVLERDEYFDNEGRTLSISDYVLRVRTTGDQCAFALKGPRIPGLDQAYSRVEIELPGGPPAEVKEALGSRGYRRTWTLEKRRSYFMSSTPNCSVVLDEVPELGSFIEIEGSPEFIDTVLQVVREYCGPPESRNYQKLLASAFTAAGGRGTLRGADFTGGFAI